MTKKKEELLKKRKARKGHSFSGPESKCYPIMLSSRNLVLATA